MKEPHHYIPLTDETEADMLSSIGCRSVEELFRDIPVKFRLDRELKLPSPHSEIEVMNRMRHLANKNVVSDPSKMFLGGGVYLHHIPAAVDALAGRSEFVTSYTSYQPEVSQGMLQTLFEYQSMLAEMLSIDVVNSSMYDMGSSLGEAVRMAVRVSKKPPRFLVPATMNPYHARVMRTYIEAAGIRVDPVGYDRETGLLDLSDLKTKVDAGVAGVYIENPSHLGFFESQVDEISEIVHAAGSLLVVGVDLLSLGLIRPPGEYDADIVIGEGQVLGNSMSFGGPLLGVFGCKNDRKLVYQLPGRLVGMTTTVDEPFDRGYVLTLSPREQHIRREKATSNICSNQALMAVHAAVYMSLLGPSGLSKLGELILYNSNYAAQKLDEIPGVSAPAVGKTFWKNFVVRFDNGHRVKQILDDLLDRGIHAGISLVNDFPELGESMLVSVTEVHDRKSIDSLADAVAIAAGSRR
ncbi:MAG: aminomethyl-transferring glycine dehydrogenase subunit GcvPA [Candidatus Thorarchaeota archaeon]